MNPTPSTPIDEDLAALRAGRTAAVCEKIVALHGPLVKAACRRVLQDESLAEDAAQETFVLLVKKATSLPPDTSLAGWLYHTASRTAMNLRRTAMRRRLRENSVEAMNQMTSDTQPNPWNEIEPHLDEAMLALPDRQRDLVVQCYFQNQSQRSAATALGCSESVVSRELGAAIETLRRFFAKRQVTVSSVALTGLLSTHAASASVVGSAAAVTAMMATSAAAVTATTVAAALTQSKFLLVAGALAGTAAIAVTGYHLASPGTGASAYSPQVAEASAFSPQGQQRSGVSKSAKGKSAANANGNGAPWRGKWEGSFKFTSAMALEEKKKQVLLEADPEVRFALLQKMGIRLSRAGFDALAAKDMDASVAPWRDTFMVLANRTEMFDNYLMAWGNEDPLGALDWVAAQPDGGLGLRKQLLYALTAKRPDPETLRRWVAGLTTPVMKKEATIALESIDDPSKLVALMGTGGNEGFLVDLAMLQGDRLDWAAFARKLAMGKSAIVARAMRQILDGAVTPQQLEQVVQELTRSDDPNIGVGAATILRAARGDAGVNYLRALQLAVTCDQAGMSDFSTNVLQGWAKVDPAAALQHTAGLKNLAGLREVMRALPGVPDEATVLEWMAASPPKARDIALANLYGMKSSSPFDQLQRIMESTTILDQVEAAKEVMRSIPLEQAPAAAQWLKQVPPGRDLQELAASLVRRLATVDPRATLELVQRGGLQGQDYVLAVTTAVTQFAAQNDLAESARFIQQLSDPQMHAQALGQLAMVKFPGRPQEAFTFLQAHSRSDWQTAALHMLTDVYYNKLGNIDANAAAILQLELPRLGPEVAKRANVLCKAWIDHRVPLDVPLAWVQQLPPPMAREARLLLARNNEVRRPTLQQYQAWVQTAQISQGERTQLLNVLGRRLGDLTAQ